MFRPAVLLAALLACGCANIPADNPPEAPASAAPDLPAGGAPAELAGAPGSQQVPFVQATPTQRQSPSTRPAAEPETPPGARPVLVGGYSPANPSDPELMAAEKMAIEEIYRREPQRSLVEDVQREAQVVAGMNYRFTVKMSGMNSYRVVVFRPLDAEMMVTSFEKLTSLN